MNCWLGWADLSIGAFGQSQVPGTRLQVGPAWCWHKTVTSETLQCQSEGCSAPCKACRPGGFAVHHAEHGKEGCERCSVQLGSKTQNCSLPGFWCYCRAVFGWRVAQLVWCGLVCCGRLRQWCGEPTGGPAAWMHKGHYAQYAALRSGCLLLTVNIYNKYINILYISTGCILTGLELISN